MSLGISLSCMAQNLLKCKVYVQRWDGIECRRPKWGKLAVASLRATLIKGLPELRGVWSCNKISHLFPINHKHCLKHEPLRMCLLQTYAHPHTGRHNQSFSVLSFVCFFCVHTHTHIQCACVVKSTLVWQLSVVIVYYLVEWTVSWVIVTQTLFRTYCSNQIHCSEWARIIIK